LVESRRAGAAVTGPEQAPMIARRDRSGCLKTTAAGPEAVGAFRVIGWILA
jgi:hypothetical protein